MLSIANELDKAIGILRTVAPKTMYIGSLIKVSRAANPLDNSVVETTDTADVEIIPDVIKSDEVDGSRILFTDFKFHIIASPTLNVGFYDEVIIKNSSYPDRRLKIRQKTDIVEGMKNLMFTVVAR